ncbi:hypothetical protein FA13DRAFT_1731709, partial [Coprinellus micaceus]
HCVEESLNHGERELLLLPRKRGHMGAGKPVVGRKPSIVFDFGKSNSRVAPSRPHPHSSQLKTQKRLSCREAQRWDGLSSSSSP